MIIADFISAQEQLVTKNHAGKSEAAVTRPAAPDTSALDTAKEYVLGPEDMITVRVLDAKEYCQLHMPLISLAMLHCLESAKYTQLV